MAVIWCQSHYRKNCEIKETSSVEVENAQQSTLPSADWHVKACSHPCKLQGLLNQIRRLKYRVVSSGRNVSWHGNKPCQHLVVNLSHVNRFQVVDY